MRFEPPLPRARLLEALRDAYAIPAVELRFLPIGFNACYEAGTAHASRYFLKLWPHLRAGEPEAAQQHTRLAVSRALVERGLGVRAVQPLATRSGDVWADVDGVPFALFPFLEDSVRATRSPALFAALARALAALHRATPLLQDFDVPRETFVVAFEPALRANLEAAALIEESAPAGLLGARDWVLAHRAGIEAQLGRLHLLQAAVRGLDGPPVLCHTDLHGNNVLVDATGALHLLDWDDVRLAPPEHDLWIALGDGAVGGDLATLRAFFEAYRDAGGANTLDLRRFEFYLLRRYLEDWSIALARSLDPVTDFRDRGHWLGGLVDWGVPRWSRLDETLAVLAAALA